MVERELEFYLNNNHWIRGMRGSLTAVFLLLITVSALTPVRAADTGAEGGSATSAQGGDSAQAEGGAAASNPLAAVNNTDLKWTYLQINGPNSSRRNDFWIKGGWLFAAWGKLSYELTYTETDITGSSEKDWESLSLKPIFFIGSGQLGSWKYRLATGFEWILDFDNQEQGIGSGSDQIAPLFGVALSPRQGTTVIPLVQHFVSYSGNDVNTTGFRFIVVQRLPHQMWTKLDAIAPYDWENDRFSATAEVELGRMLTPLFGVYVSGLAGIGNDRFIDWGASLNVRFSY